MRKAVVFALLAAALLPRRSVPRRLPRALPLHPPRLRPPAPAGATTGAAAETTTGTTATAAASTQPDLSVPKDDAAKWVVGFTVLASDGLSMESRYLAYSLPLLLRDEVSGLTSHLYDDKEIDALRRLIVARQISASGQGGDEPLPGDPEPPRRTRPILSTGEDDLRLQAAVARGDFLRKLDVSLITVAKEKRSR